MTSNNSGGRRPQVIHLIEKEIFDAGEAGLTLEALRNRFPEYDRYQINRSANNLDAQGRCFKSGRGVASNCTGVKWFSQRQWAEAFAALPPEQRGEKRRSGAKRHDRTYAEMLFKRRAAEHAAADRKTSNQPREAVVTEKTRITIAPPAPDRWNVALPATGGFSNSKPGEYDIEPTSCAAKALA